MIPNEWLQGEVAVIGLGKSGTAAARLLARRGARIYASDAAVASVASADALRALAIDVELGAHDLERIRRATLVVASPGIPPGAPPIVAAHEAGVPVVGEIEIALRVLGEFDHIAVSGTNGKTTTTALVAHLLRALGLDAVAAGNIGMPLAEVALREQHPDWVSLELSSFQLHDTPSLDPTVGVLTTLSPDHLDRYADVEEYFSDKSLLFRNAHEFSVWVINGDVPEAREMVRDIPGTTSYFSVVERGGPAYYDRDAELLMVLGQPLLARAELPLIGDHNVANALAAALAVMLADAAHATADARARIAQGLRTFAALPHRLESAGTFGGVTWINDSKATNVSSTLVALEGMTRPTVVLLGGRHKGEPYTSLAAPLRRVARHVIAYGEAGPIIEQDLGSLVTVERMGSDFGAVMARAREVAQPGDVVLLSPACSSYDMFRNYEERGATFRRMAAEQGGESPGQGEAS